MSAGVQHPGDRAAEEQALLDGQHRNGIDGVHGGEMLGGKPGSRRAWANDGRVSGARISEPSRDAA